MTFVDRFKRELRSLPRAYWALWLATLVDRLGGFVMPFLMIYLTDVRGLGAARAGMITACFGAGAALGSPVGGWCADRVGRRVTMLFAMCGAASAVVALGSVRAPLLLASAVFGVGFLASMGRPAVNAAVADLVPEPFRLRAYGLLYWAANLGFSLAPITAGYIAGHSYGLLFGLDAATTLGCALIVALHVRETRSSESHPASASQDDFWVALNDPMFVRFIAVIFVVATAFHQLLAALPLAMRRSGLSPAQYGTVMAWTGVVVIALQPPASRWLQRFGRFRVLAAGALLVGAGYGLNIFAHTMLTYALGATVFTVGEVAFIPVGMAVVADIAPIDRRGRYQGVYSMAWGLSICVAPALGPWLLDRFGATALWSGCFAAGVLAAAAFLARSGEYEARRRQVSASPLGAPEALAGAVAIAPEA